MTLSIQLQPDCDVNCVINAKTTFLTLTSLTHLKGYVRSEMLIMKRLLG
jgi:hypothetical protein